MDLRYSAADEAFRAEVRDWLASAVPTIGAAPSSHDWPARRRYDTAWQRRLFDQGYAGINWPSQFGGGGLSPTEQLVFSEEAERARAPYVGVNFVGLLHAGPTLIAEGSDAQRAAHLPAILRGDEVWCQGFSEPSSGSDLASLRTRAVRDGDDYVVTGQKIWTSHAQVADFCELLVRTDPDAPKHRGISWLILPMDSPGVEIRPLRTLAGSTEFSEMFLDEVRVPVANRVGVEHDGWRVAMVTFSFERGTAFVGEMLQSIELLSDLAALARRLPKDDGGTVFDDAGVQRELGRAAADLEALSALTKRNISEAARTGVPGVGGSVFKLYYSEVRQRMGDLAMRILDRAALCLSDIEGAEGGAAQVQGRLHALSISIAAGTSQIQRNIVGERILGLPKER